MDERKTKDKILKVLGAIPNGVLYSTADWHRIIKEDKRDVKHALEELVEEGTVEVIRDAEGRPDKPLYRLNEPPSVNG